MKRISRYFKTLKSAERYLNQLYNQYDYVQLVASPMFTEQGTYTWEVR